MVASIRRIATRGIVVLATGLGIGRIGFAPGTLGTLLAVPLYLLLAGLPPAAYLAVVAVMFVAGVALCDVAERALGRHDHPSIVWDEGVGFLITMFAAPPGWAWLILGFILFRLFDIWKPWFIRRIDRVVRGGFGSMLDDAVAGACAWALLQIGYRFAPLPPVGA